MTFKPLLASPPDWSMVRLPVLASPKLDGIRAIKQATLVSRKLIAIPNRYVQQLFNLKELEGFDGELILGEPTAKDVYRRTTSVVMSHDKPAADVVFWVFDYVHPNYIDRPYCERLAALQAAVKNLGSWIPVRVLPQLELLNRQLVDAFEEDMVNAGYEGIMIRDPNGRYKQGRSTAAEGILLKVKRFEDSEARVVSIEEEMFNGNTAERDNLGRTKRSSAKAGKTGKGTMGALVVQDAVSGVTFNIGSGFTAADRQADWPLGTLVKYKYFPVGVKDKPRHPIFIGRRDERDM